VKVLAAPIYRASTRVGCAKKSPAPTGGAETGSCVLDVPPWQNNSGRRKWFHHRRKEKPRRSGAEV
jgi:hypothetical protein